MLVTISSRIASPRGTAYISRHPFDNRRVGAAAVYCSDGRYGEQMDEFLHEGLGLPRYDRVATPGGAACLARASAAYYEKESLEKQLRFLIEAHELRKVVLIAHQDCGFYRQLWLGDISMASAQEKDLALAAERIRTYAGALEVEAYFARPTGSRVEFDRWV
jgi:hypothetical protein